VEVRQLMKHSEVVVVEETVTLFLRTLGKGKRHCDFDSSDFYTDQEVTGRERNDATIRLYHNAQSCICLVLHCHVYGHEEQSLHEAS
jgi:hypothetical protein